MNVILFQPQIPQNTGNIVRTCAVCGASLCLIKPLGFSLSKRQLRRAGLDYWESVEVEQMESLAPNEKMLFFSTRGKKRYTEAPYTAKSQLVFGSETAGLPEEIHTDYADQIYTIPMRPGQRSLNLSNSVAIILYEAWRQLDFA